KTEVTDKSETYEQHKITKYVAVLLFTILVLYGFASNIFMATVLFCRKRNNRYNREFILIASQIIICDFMALFPHIIVVLPEIILRGKKNFYGSQRNNMDKSHVFNFGHIPIFFHTSFFISANTESLRGANFTKMLSFFQVNKAIHSNRYCVAIDSRCDSLLSHKH
uniref:G_PROTEIN_RECEP_F1_2 domain-containing protein n=1 Tax=Elaeophora elaphi TaxID=1147741 RepID=A0A0R3RP23_9BILA